MNDLQPLCPQGKRNKETASRGSPAAWASVPPSAQWGELYPQKQAESPPWPWGLTKAKHAQGWLTSPPLCGPAWACLPESAVPGMGPSPAPPSLGPLLEGQGVRSEGPSPRRPTLHPGLCSPRPVPSLPGPMQALGGRPPWKCPDPNSHPLTLAVRSVRNQPTTVLMGKLRH